MEDEDDDLSNAKLMLSRKLIHNVEDIDNICTINEINIGEFYFAYVVLFCPSVSQINGEKDRWKKKIAFTSGIANTHCITCTETHNCLDTANDITSQRDYTKTIPCNSLVEDIESFKSQMIFPEPFFLNETLYVIPLPVYLTHVCHESDQVQLTVSIYKNLKINRNPRINDEDFKLKLLDVPSLPPSAKVISTQRTITKTLTLRQPPELKIKYNEVTGRHLVFICVHNQLHTSIWVKDCEVISGSCHLKEDFSEMQKQRITVTNGCVCRMYGSPLSLVTNQDVQFPIQLCAKETLSLIYKLSPDELDQTLQNLAFHAHLKWKVITEGQYIMSSYSLPNLKIRHVPFVLSASSEEVHLDKSFTVTYYVKNNLQDFLSWRMYWGPTYIRSTDDIKTCNFNDKKKSSLVCHDPIIDFGPFKKNDVIPVKVDFSVSDVGLYEFGQNMKLNLTFNVQSMKSEEQRKKGSLKSPINSPDQYLVASEELWRGRLGSTSSFDCNNSADEKRHSFATKSYSFGDLGPSKSQDSIEEQTTCFKRTHRADEKENQNEIRTPDIDFPESNISLANFKKNSLQIYFP